MTVQATLASAVTLAGAFLLTAANAASETINSTLPNAQNGTVPMLGGLSNGTIGGISVGAAVGGAIIVGGIYCCVRTFCGRSAGNVAAAGATAGLIANAV